MRIEKVSKNWRVLNSKQAIPAFKKKNKNIKDLLKRLNIT